MQLAKTFTAAGLTLAALLLAACGGNADPLGEGSAAPTESAPGGGPIVVGSANFTESNIIAEIYSQALAAKGIESSTKLGIGSREVYIKALQDKSIAVVPEYTGKPRSTSAERTRIPRTSRPACLRPRPATQVLKSSVAIDRTSMW